MLSHESDPPSETPNKLGVVLVAEGKITEEQLLEAKERKGVNGQNFGQALVSLGHLSEVELAQAYSRLFNLEYVDLSAENFDSELLGVISEDVLVRHEALPIRIENGRLIVAMRDPCDRYARSDLTISAGHPITPAVAAEDG